MPDTTRAETLAHVEDAGTISETTETALRKRRSVSQAIRETKRVPHLTAVSPKVRSISEAAASRRQAANVTAEREIDKVIWPLLDTGLSVRAIAAQANTSTATIGRSRQRWNSTSSHVSVTNPETSAHADYETGRETVI